MGGPIGKVRVEEQVMYAVVANGFQAVVQTRERLDVIISIFPYPKFQYVKTEDEGRQWIRENSRSSYTKNITNYGNSSNTGFVVVDYFICNNCIYYNIRTDRLGFIRIPTQDGVFYDQRPELIKAKVVNVNLNDLLIMHHVIAIQRVLLMIGSYVDVVVNVPDMSVFLTLTKYSGKNYVVQRTKELINKRVGSVSYTVVEGMEFNRDEFEYLFDL